MGTIRTNEVFNDDTLNIFTDASVKLFEGENGKEFNIVSPGAIMRLGTEMIEVKTEIIKDWTNNRAEIYAILIGINMAIKYIIKHKHIRYVNLYSDSRISVIGLREWVFKWNNINNVLYGSSNTPIANQDIFISIIKTLVDFDLDISLFHVKGHNTYSTKSRYDFVTSFRKQNNIHHLLDDELINLLIDNNDMIDNITRTGLQLIDIKDIDNFVYEMPLVNRPIDINYNRYKKLISDRSNSYFTWHETNN